MDKIIDCKKYKLIYHLHSSLFGSYNIVKNSENDRFHFAKISSSKIYFDSSSRINRKSRSFLEGAERISSFTNEIEIHSKLFHPSIIRFIGYSQTDFNGEQYPTIFTQYAANGTLRDILNNKNAKAKGWNGTKKFSCVYGIAAGMAYLHKKKIIHFNLCPENILMDSYLLPKIAEFASAQSNSSDRNKIRFDSLFYTAPEIYDEDLPINEKADVYSFGIILNEIYTRKVPYDGNKNPFLLQSKISNNFRPDLPSKSSLTSMKLLISRCWDQDSKQRPSFSEILDILNSDTFIKNKKMKINKDDFRSYVDYIDSAVKIYETNPNQNIIISDYIKNRLRSEIKVIDMEIYPSDKRKRLGKRFDFSSIKNPINFEILKAQELSKNGKDESQVTRNARENIIYPSSSYINLPQECQNIVYDAESGDFNSINIIVNNLINGSNGFPQDPEIAIQYLKEGVRLGDSQSMLFFADMLSAGEIIPQNYKKAINLYQQIVELNDKNYYEAKVKLFQFQLSNDKKISSLFNDEIDLEQVKNICKEAADDGCVEGMLLYATLCMKAKSNGENKEPITRNVKDAFKYAAAAAERGSKEAMAFYGQLIDHGYGIRSTSKKESKELIQKSNELGSLTGKALCGYEKAQNKETEEEGLRLVVESKEEENSTAINAYGMIIFNGFCGFIADEERGAYYMKMAADMGNANAMYNYASCLQKGRGVKKNVKEAIYYYIKSLEEGCLTASFSLGDLLMKRDNEFVNPDEGRRYLKISTEYKINLFKPNEINLLL